MFTDGICDIGSKLSAGSSLLQNQNWWQSLIHIVIFNCIDRYHRHITFQRIISRDSWWVTYHSSVKILENASFRGGQHLPLPTRHSELYRLGRPDAKLEHLCSFLSMYSVLMMLAQLASWPQKIEQELESTQKFAASQQYLERKSLCILVTKVTKEKGAFSRHLTHRPNIF